MELELIGPHPFGTTERGGQLNGIGTAFPLNGALFTLPPPVHSLQRLGFIDHLNGRRAASDQPPLTPEEAEKVIAGSVDLIFEAGKILIRPDPERMDLAFAADEMLQGLVSKRQIEFLKISDVIVRDSIKRRGECWRLNSLAKTLDAKEKLILGSRIAIDGLPIYFYNRQTGTRWLTYHAFEKLGELDHEGLARHLQEIADYFLRVNRTNRPEVTFFAADLRHFSGRGFAGVVYAQLPPEQLRAKFAELREHFQSAVHESFRRDDTKDKSWVNRMMAALFLEGNETQTEHILSGMSPEFYLQIEWLPGGRFEEGEFLFDPIFDEAASHPEDESLQDLCDDRAKAIIFNFIREYGNLEYVNLGRVPEPLSRARARRGRRAVYIAELKPHDEVRPIRRFIRLQKWGVAEHLDEGKDLLQSLEESDDYADYWLDRRLGCRQLGMNLTRRVIMRRLGETYEGKNPRYRGLLIRTTYFERDYLPGVASDKIPGETYAKPHYATRLAALLGTAAASSIIVGRAFDEGRQPVFDDGDEVVKETTDGLPSEILVGDHSGAFGEYRAPLETFAEHYARPVHARVSYLSNPAEFAQIYLAAFREKFLTIQGDYRKRRRAFDTLFKNSKYDPQGSFAFRWECVLRRLDRTEVDVLIAAIRAHINVLNPQAMRG